VFTITKGAGSEEVHLNLAHQLKANIPDENSYSIKLTLGEFVAIRELAGVSYYH